MASSTFLKGAHAKVPKKKRLNVKWIFVEIKSLVAHYRDGAAATRYEILGSKTKRKCRRN
jgi:hypothetical protein